MICCSADRIIPSKRLLFRTVVNILPFVPGQDTGSVPEASILTYTFTILSFRSPAYTISVLSSMALQGYIRVHTSVLFSCSGSRPVPALSMQDWPDTEPFRCPSGRRRRPAPGGSVQDDNFNSGFSYACAAGKKRKKAKIPLASGRRGQGDTCMCSLHVQGAC